MTKRIFHAILSVALTVLLASLILTVGVLHGYFQDRVLEELSSRTAYIALGLEHEGEAYLKNGFPNDCRVTWVAADGSVLWDNCQTPEKMEDHKNRPEIRQAMESGEGHSARYSDTLAQKTIYYAMRLPDGTVVRVADSSDSVWMLVLQAMQPVALVMLLAFCLALWLAGRLAQQLVKPINAVDVNDPGEELDYEELAPLVEKLRSQKRQIRSQMEDLRRSREEFTAITENMSEGLVIIDRNTWVLSYNAAALRLLHAQAPEGESSVLALNRDSGFRRCVEQALSGRRAEELLERPEDCCRVLANPVEQEGAVSGAVLLVLDVTEKEQREALRREFTANVSHELKTPLTAILGTAEILENGMVRPEDLPHFAGNIRRESQRLICMVNDIIKLSRLDEGGQSDRWETLSIRQIAQQAVERLSLAAQQKNVNLTLEGSCGAVRGVGQIAEEIVYNLCDNAIAYNHPGGSVRITLSSEKEGECLRVSDTGVGIPPELQERVFERFYRVDKSHTGRGTGLGLSIVKHGAAYLGGQVKLESTPGKGSTFTLILPPAP